MQTRRGQRRRSSTDGETRRETGTPHHRRALRVATGVFILATVAARPVTYTPQRGADRLAFTQQERFRSQSVLKASCNDKKQRRVLHSTVLLWKKGEKQKGGGERKERRRATNNQPERQKGPRAEKAHLRLVRPHKPHKPHQSKGENAPQSRGDNTARKQGVSRKSPLRRPISKVM
jgi:hypothetical protein